MKISLNKIKQYVKIPADIFDADLISLIGSRLVEIEDVVDLAPIYQGIYIVKVVHCKPIPDTHLHLCQIDAGPHNSAFDQLENGLIQVVCGAPNVRAGMLTAWIAPGAIVPSTFGEENFQISARKLRGHMSNGMLAALDELNLGDDHEGIIEIAPQSAHPGDTFAEIFDLNDKILDVENKSLTHRPDCFGIIGFAREVAGILGQKFTEPEVFSSPHTSIISHNAEKVNIKIADSTLCPRYSCAVFDLPDNKPSKYLTQEAVFLAKAGMRTIDPMVDLTNILMLETGQPLHAFDYDKLITVGGTKTPKILIRAARAGEELQLLDGKTIKCTAADILITSNSTPIALAGAMGGKNTEIDASTRRVILESATFSLYNLRKTQMTHGIFSEAITRFTKGQPAAMTMPVLAEAVKHLAVETLAIADDYPDKAQPSVVNITTSDINQLLGTNYSANEIATTLENVGFDVKANEWCFSESRHPGVSIIAPLWRTDIYIKEDITEELGRLLGYDNIPLSLPEKPFIMPEIDPIVNLKRELRNILSLRLAMNELLTYSFVSRDLLAKVGLDPADCYEIVNSISPELQSFRSAITPSLLDKIRENLKSGHRAFTLYEMNQVTQKSSGLDPEKVPTLQTHLGIVSLSDFYSLKSNILALFRELKITVAIQPISPSLAKNHPYLEPKRSAELLVNDQVIGAFGEVKSSVLRQFKLDPTISALELNLDAIINIPRATKSSLKISKFPSVERDLTLRVSSDAPFDCAHRAIEDGLSQQSLYYTVTPLSIYQPDDSATKNLSFHLKFSSPAHTLNSSEISDIMDHITIAVTDIGAEIV